MILVIVICKGDAAVKVDKNQCSGDVWGKSTLRKPGDDY
jgi:hypothetical protein